MINRNNINISIVIPTLNRHVRLKKLLGLLFVKSIDSGLLHETIVVDDGSTDETRHVLESFGGAIRHVRTERSGQAAARNLGVALATGSHVLFLDDDLLVPEGYLQDIATVYRSTACDWVVGKVVTAAALPDSSLVRFLKESERLVTPGPGLVGSVMEGTFTAANLLVEKEGFLRLGGFRTDYYRSSCEDLDLGERALNAGIRIWYTPELAVEHYDLNMLDPWRFAVRQYHGCIGQAQFLSRFPHLRAQSALFAKVAPEWRPGGFSRPIRRWARKLMASAPVRWALLRGAALGETMPLPDRLKWLVFRAAISSQMMAGISRGLSISQALPQAQHTRERMALEPCEDAGLGIGAESRP